MDAFLVVVLAVVIVAVGLAALFGLRRLRALEGTDDKPTSEQER